MTSIKKLQKFCAECWKSGKNAHNAYIRLWLEFIKLPTEAKMELIPELVKNSKYYPQLISLASEWFDSLTNIEQKRLSIPPVFWFGYGVVFITEEEYLYRRAHGMPAEHYDSSYMRPAQPCDSIYNRLAQEMAMKSGSVVIVA